jgi:hypothetical protein
VDAGEKSEMRDLAAVEAEVRRCMAQLGKDIPAFRFERGPRGDATPHVEIHTLMTGAPQYDWVISERGTEFERRTVNGPELLFITVESLTCAIVQAAELRSRCNDDYSRWTWMQAHIGLMARLDPDWGKRVAARYEAVLATYPLNPQEKAFSRTLDI